MHVYQGSDIVLDFAIDVYFDGETSPVHHFYSQLDAKIRQKFSPAEFVYYLKKAIQKYGEPL